ncbi:MAG: TRAP transporter small permease [Lentisphaerae bacterium]|nr:TRAP transporter small permease [Lentisphaerota bacterium]
MLDVLLKLKKGMIAALNGVLIVAVFMLVASVVWGVLTRSIGSLVVKMAGDSGWEPWSWLPTGQATWTEEIARFLLIWVSLLGGAVAFGTKGHLGVDFFVGKFDPDARKLMMVVSHLIVLFFAAAVFLYGGWRVVGGAMEQKTSALTFLKMGHVYMALPIAGVFMVLFTIENLIETLATPASKLCEPEAEVE